MSRRRCCCGGGGGGPTCGGCTFPAANLTLSWTGVGGVALGSTTLVFDGVNTWASGCASNVIYRFSCISGTLSFSATSYTGAPCPSGTPVICSVPGSLGSNFLPKTLQCSPLLVQYDTSEPIPFSPPRVYCNTLYGLGYRSITITL